ncbi:MAG: aspartate--tRNA(Asn) ligase [Candidatus Yanofskybacteria bacterium]|nr:aspartate--tRNA(Asn) ligase [Candidatus Yanofskybacteria bacterium]
MVKNRILSSDLKNSVGKNVVVAGWLYKKRELGGMTFLIIRDRNGLIQVLDDKSKESEKLKGFHPGTVLIVQGEVVEEKRAPGGIEIHSPKLTVEVPVDLVPPIEIDKPLSHDPQNLDTLFDYRVIGLRNVKESAVFKIQAEIKDAMRQFLKKNDFVEFNSPKLLAGSTEGGAEVFKLDYFGKPATLAQSAQFYKQIMVGVFERVFEINPTFRAEPSATTRHMTEFMHLDVEIGFIDFKGLINLIGRMLKEITEQVWKSCEPELALWGATKSVLPKEIPIMTLAEIHKKYSTANGQKTIGEKDLRPDEERWICEYAKEQLGSEAIFVIEWPASEMKFYHRLNDENPEIADRFDLLFRGVEIATGSMREHRYDMLIQQLKKLAGGDPENPGFKYYLQAFKFGMPPHGGIGMGLERLTQKIIGLSNVKEASLFPRDMNRLAP